jgi:hypothetical protein
MDKNVYAAFMMAQYFVDSGKYEWVKSASYQPTIRMK